MDYEDSDDVLPESPGLVNMQSALFTQVGLYESCPPLIYRVVLEGLDQQACSMKSFNRHLVQHLIRETLLMSQLTIIEM